MPSIGKRARSTGGYLASAARTIALSPLLVARFVAAQAAGTWRNVRGFLGWLTLDRAVPPVVADTLRWLGNTVPRALGLGDTTNYEQTAAASVLILGAVSATVLTFGLTAAVVVGMLPFLFIGLGRFVPAANGAFQSARGKIQSRGSDGPRWERDK